MSNTYNVTMRNQFALGTALWRWRMRRILKRHLIPHHIWQSVTRRILVLKGLDAVQMAHLREMTSWFLDQKSITGAQGLDVTLTMRVTIAVQACLLILNLGESLNLTILGENIFLKTARSISLELHIKFIIMENG